jgi:hypothetical protein
MHMRRGYHLGALFFITCCVVGMFGNASGSIVWPAWIPTSYKGLGWTSLDANITCRIQNPIFNDINGSSNDTAMYSQALVNTNEDILLVNYFDLEESTGSHFTSNPFSQTVPQSAKVSLNQEIKKFTNVSFDGSTIWDLVVFTFTEIWNDRLQGFMITASEQTIGGHPAVLLEYGGNAGLGCVAFVNIGTKIGLVFNVARNSTWKNATVFSRSIQAFVTGFLAPLQEVLYAAYFDAFSIIASGITPPHASISSAQATTFLDRATFLSVMNSLMGQLAEPSYPFQLTWNQILLIIGIVAIVIIIICYGIMSYKKDKKKLPDKIQKNEPSF